MPGYYGAECGKAAAWAEYYRLKKCPRFTVAVPVPASMVNGTVKFLANYSETVPAPTSEPCTLDQDSLRAMMKIGSPCPNACSGTGVCLNGTCACIAGHTGNDCSEAAEPLKCPGSCSYRGVCVFGRCSCMPPYKGVDCSESDDPEARKALQSNACPKNCRGRGRCVRGRCSCDPGYAGHDCALDIPCKDNCNGRGRCDRGRCFCFPGFEGASCSKVSRCPGGCSAHGQCFYGKCFCDPYYAGEDCSATPTCTKGCHAEHGICRGEDLCVCEPGWTGVACSEKRKLSLLLSGVLLQYDVRMLSYGVLYCAALSPVLSFSNHLWRFMMRMQCNAPTTALVLIAVSARRPRRASSVSASTAGLATIAPSVCNCISLPSSSLIMI